jgi:hypothetical protein
VLAKVDGAWAFGFEDVARQRDRNRSGRIAVVASLNACTQVKQARVTTLEESPDLSRLK